MTTIGIAIYKLAIYKKRNSDLQARATNSSLPPYSLPADDPGGGPSAHRKSVHGDAISLEIDTSICRSGNLQRINKWLRNHGYKHSAACGKKYAKGRRAEMPGCKHDSNCQNDERRNTTLERITT